MKTPYEKTYKYSLQRLLIGKTKKKSRSFYATLIVLYIFIYLLVEGMKLL
ncbi:hypothetical protein OKW21_002340 [Catalinimonas alkaloidigena]|nr:hypothetical protein [Catalinimonas alkaloidigena]